MTCIMHISSMLHVLAPYLYKKLSEPEAGPHFQWSSDQLTY